MNDEKQKKSNKFALVLILLAISFLSGVFVCKYVECTAGGGLIQCGVVSLGGIGDES